VKALIQRVKSAQVRVDSEIIGEIGVGWLVFLGVARTDSGAETMKLVDKITGLRLFPDAEGRFNLSVIDVSGSILVVSQFTLYADCSRGRRPSFTDAAEPEKANHLYEQFIRELRMKSLPVATGRFGADMEVSLVNDGPVTILLDSATWSAN
jgi:D-tyrosyl-tRNA(Tyr) deacylase